MFKGTAAGDTALSPGRIVDVTGIDHAAGQYVVTGCIHRINARVGYATEITSEPEPPPKQSTDSIVTCAKISQIADPEHMTRVRATLPTFGDVETDWMPVVMNGAGKNKGLMMLPEVGDQVLVLLAHGDPAQGIVLGGLYGIAGAPDDGIDHGDVRRYTLLTRGGQKIQLDDTNRAVRLENSDGSFVEMHPEKMTLHAATDLDIEAPGHTVIIRGNKIDFQRR